MKQLKTILLTLVGVLTVIACKNEQGKINKEQIENIIGAIWKQQNSAYNTGGGWDEQISNIRGASSLPQVSFWDEQINELTQQSKQNPNNNIIFIFLATTLIRTN